MPETLDPETGDLIVSRVTMSTEVGELFTALAKAQGDIGAAERDGKNPHYDSTYSTLRAVRAACQAPLAAHGLCVLQPPTSEDGQHVTIVTIIGHQSGQWLRSELTLRARDSGPQSVVSCVTYGRRTALAAITGVTPEDDDGNAATDRTDAPQATRAMQRPPGEDRGFPAKWGGRDPCPKCDGTIMKGEQIRRGPNSQYEHVECPGRTATLEDRDSDDPPPLTVDNDIPF